MRHETFFVFTLSRSRLPCRRTAFVYELEEAAAGDIPTTLRRSKEDCPKVRSFWLPCWVV
jgi:hypothetical protein